MRPQQEVLRKLVSEYQETHSRSSFEGILKRVDWLVLYVINKLQNQFFYYKNIGFDELYQTAVVGVGEAILTVKKTENGDKIVARIIAYIRAAIKRSFKVPKEISGGGICEKYLSDFSKEELSKMIDIIDFCEIEIYPYLNEAEQDLLHKRFFESKTYREIAKTADCGKSGVRWRTLKILKNIKLRLFEKGF
ncbi:MAG: hypothetical protein ACTSUP_07940 [Candidatus Heimdallarchaeaceae archaeon]